jgi:rhamnosyltransferase subunit B
MRIKQATTSSSVFLKPANFCQTSTIENPISKDHTLRSADIIGTTELNILMFGLGTHGDLYPVIAVGKALRQRGHRVRIVANDYFETTIRKADLEFVSDGKREDYIRVTQDPDLWTFPAGLRILLTACANHMVNSYDFVLNNHITGKTVVICSNALWGARIANEKWGIPLTTLHFHPLALRSLNQDLGFGLPRILQPIMQPLRKLSMSVLDQLVIDPVILPPMNRFRNEIGLPPIKRPYHGWIHSPQLNIGLFPPWFAPHQEDWPANVHLTGFPLYDSAQADGLPKELTDYLTQGEAPIIFTLGTAMQFAKNFFRVSVEACRLLGRRGLILSLFEDQVPRSLPSNIRHFKYASLNLLLPRAAAIVHHGGIGTLSQALKAGIPQIIVPHNFDQPYSATRVQQLGVGHLITVKRYQTAYVAKTLNHILTSHTIANRCRSFANRFHDNNTMQETCNLIESFMRQHPVARLEAQGPRLK